MAELKSLITVTVLDLALYVGRLIGKVDAIVPREKLPRSKDHVGGERKKDPKPHERGRPLEPRSANVQGSWTFVHERGITL